MFRTWNVKVLGLLVSVLLAGLMNIVSAEPEWRIDGEYFEGCTCNPGCPCLFGSEPTHNRTCKITGVFHIKKGTYGKLVLDGQTVIGITDLTAAPDKNWIVFYINSKDTGEEENRALLDIFHNSVFSFADVPEERIDVKYLPIQIESTKWRKKALVNDYLVLDVEILRGSGDPDRPTQIVNKNFPVWSKEFDTTLDMGKALTHRFTDINHEWNYDGRSGFSTNFHFSSN